MRLLHIDTTARIQNSFSRQLTQFFVTAWQQHSAGSEVLYRDIGTQPIPHIDEQWIMAYEAEAKTRTPALKSVLQLSDTLIDELLMADVYVWGIPMYNLTVPSTVKAYLDQVVRRDRIFSFQNGQPQGLLLNKKLLIITTRKFNYRPGSGREKRDFLEPYLRAIWGIVGVHDITFVHADNLANSAAESVTSAQQILNALALKWTARD